MCESAAVREGDELREGVGALGAPEECGMSTLGADIGGGCLDSGGSDRAAAEGDVD